ncbi:MAG: hypothetical protein LBE97_00140, partial [Holosporales bacterium]|nr:hypothetical protein [Holosporales bacterium]
MYIRNNNNKYKSYKSGNFEKEEKLTDLCLGDSLVDPKRISEPAKKPPTENQNSPTRVQTKYDNIVLDCTQAIAEEFHPDKYPHMRVFLTQQLARFIHAAIKFKFNYSLEAFRRYLQQVKAS